MRKRITVFGGVSLVVLLMAIAVIAGELEPQSYLPVYYNPPPTPTMLPTATPQPGLLNGNFEAGHAGWLEYSAYGYPIIVNNNELPDAVNARSGQWATWFGGEHNETSAIEQSVFVAPNARQLTYYRWIHSNDICNPEYDIAGIFMDEDGDITESDIVDAFILCDGTTTNGWQGQTLDISRFAGKRVLLTFVAFTDNVILSSMFVDDVSLVGSGLQAPVELGPDSSGELDVAPARQGKTAADVQGAGVEMTEMQARVVREWLMERVETAPTR